MNKALLVVFLCSAICLAVGQNAPSKWQVGTIMAVEPHNEKQGDTADAHRYDVSLKVGDTIYVVLYTAPSDSDMAKYRTGVDLPVLVGKNTITFNDLMGRKIKVPILRREKVQAQKQSPRES